MVALRVKHNDISEKIDPSFRRSFAASPALYWQIVEDMRNVGRGAESERVAQTRGTREWVAAAAQAKWTHPKFKYSSVEELEKGFLHN